MRSREEIQNQIDWFALMKDDSPAALASWSVLRWVLEGEDEPEYKVGDPDPTPDDLSEENGCPSRSLGVPVGGYWCTWAKGHTGVHVAGDGDRIVAVWK